MMVKGRHRAAKITGNRMAWNLSLDSVKYKLNEMYLENELGLLPVLNDALTEGMEAKLIF